MAREYPRTQWEILEAFRRAANEYGIPNIPDPNTGDNEGICYFHVNQKRGRRWSAARGFLKPVLNRQNLRLETGCLVEGIDFTGRRATGIRWRQNGVLRNARCRGEVILSAGAINSPHLLMLSGVGPAAHLSQFDIPVGARQGGRRRQPAGSFAASPDLQGGRCEDAERELTEDARPPRYGA